MTLKGIIQTAFSAQDRKSLVWAIIIAVLTLTFIAVFHQYAIRDRVFLNLYYVGITVAAYALVKRRAVVLMQLVLFAAVARMLLGIHFAAKPGIANPIVAGLSDVTFWFVLLYLGWRLASGAYQYQREEIRRQVRQEVEGKSAAERGIALTTASRDIRQPLVTMRTITDGLLNEPSDTWEEFQRDSLDDLDQNLGRLMILVDNLLDYGQVEAGKTRLRCEIVSASELIQQGVASIHARAAQNGVEVRSHVDPNVGDIVADPIRLKQVIVTLLYNAVDFSKEGGTVSLQARIHDEQLILSVRDTGKGISEQEIQALFDPYREDDGSDQRVLTSLGLSLAKSLVEMHGGSMLTDSVVDSGTIFTVRLPLDASDYVAHHMPTSQTGLPMEQSRQRLDDYVRHSEHSAGTPSKLTKAGTDAAKITPLAQSEEEKPETIRVLVADPNTSVRRILRQWLIPLGCEVVETPNGSEVMELARARPTPHLIVLDARLPGMDGFAVCHALKMDSRLQLIPVIVATSTDTPEEKMRAFDAGADDFLVKPINRDELTVRLRSLLRIYRFNQELIGAEAVAMALARAVAAKDGYSQAHVGKVANYAVILGEKMGMDVSELKNLKYGAILHNVGKISIPDSVLEKQGSLSPREMALFHQHPEIGCDICSPLKPLKPVLSIIRHHKEHWDGSGYPDRLEGDKIPRGAQIVGLVDAYTALITNRPYRKALSNAEAIGILRKQTDEGWYNPELLNRFLECVDAPPEETSLQEEFAVAGEAKA